MIPSDQHKTSTHVTSYPASNPHNYIPHSVQICPIHTKISTQNNDTRLLKETSKEGNKERKSQIIKNRSKDSILNNYMRGMISQTTPLKSATTNALLLR